MILHCTAKLAAKLPGVSDAPLEAGGPLGGWHGHLVVLERRQCAFFVHDETRYSLFLPGVRKEHLVELERWHRDLFLASLAAQGVAGAQIGRARLAQGGLRCDRATDRSVLGSLRVAADDLAYTLPRWGGVAGLDPLEVAAWLNCRPTSAKGVLIWPGRAMISLVAGL